MRNNGEEEKQTALRQGGVPNQSSVSRFAGDVPASLFDGAHLPE